LSLPPSPFKTRGFPSKVSSSIVTTFFLFDHTPNNPRAVRTGLCDQVRNPFRLSLLVLSAAAVVVAATTGAIKIIPLINADIRALFSPLRRRVIKQLHFLSLLSSLYF